MIGPHSSFITTVMRSIYNSLCNVFTYMEHYIWELSLENNHCDGAFWNKNPSMAQGQMYSLFSHSSFSAIIFNCSQSITYYIVPRSIINPLCNIVSYITCFTAWRVFQVKFCMGMYHWFVWAGPLTWMKSIPICQAEADAKFSCCFKRIIYRNKRLNSKWLRFCVSHKFGEAT